MGINPRRPLCCNALTASAPKALPSPRPLPALLSSRREQQHSRAGATRGHNSDLKVILACTADAVGTRRSVTRATCLRADSKRFHQGEVKDFNAWRTSYNENEKYRASAGITNGRVFRSADDTNDVVILQDVADVSKARTWLGSNEMKSMMEKSGVIGSPNIRFAAAA